MQIVIILVLIFLLIQVLNVKIDNDKANENLIFWYTWFGERKYFIIQKKSIK